MSGILDKLDFLTNNTVGCIEVSIKDDNSYDYHFILLKRHNDNLNFEKIEIGIDSFEDLSTHLNRNIPLVLAISGKGIIFREVETMEGETYGDTIRKILPNANPPDFYIEKSVSENNTSFVSIIRREIVETIINKFIENKFFVIDVFIGPYIIQSVINLLDSPVESLNLGGYNVKTEKGKITNCTVQSTDKEDYIRIGSENVSSFALLALSAGIKSFANDLTTSHSEISSVVQNSSEFKAYKWFKFGGIGILIFFFVILLGNYFVFDHYNSKFNDLSSRLTEYQGFLNNYSQQKTDLEEKKQLLAETGMLKASQISFYADRIAAELPIGINLTELEVNPRISKKSNTKKIEFIKNKITIAGNASKGSILNDWLNLLETYEWIEEVSRFTYNTENEYKNNPAAFTIELSIN